MHSRAGHCEAFAWAAIATLVAGAALAEPPGASPSPGPRNAHALAYDAARGQTILFGGADERSVRGDTWAWQGAAWNLVTEEGPAARTFPAMAFDATRGVLLLFGGNRSLFGSETRPREFLGDTWRFDGATWTELHAEPAPSPRAEAAMAWDAAQQVIVLFGGYRIEGGETVRLGDTWEWNGERWRLAAESGPTPRNGAAMAYSAQLGGVVLFGGNGASAETWLWKETTWRRLDVDTAGRFNPGAASTPVGVVRFGGWDGAARVAETLIFDGATWSPKNSKLSPAARNHAPMAFDAARGCVVLHGGHDGGNVFADTWEWDGAHWVERRAAPPALRIDNGH